MPESGMPKEGGEREPFFRPLHSQLIAKPSMLNKAQPYGARKKEGKRLLPSGHLLRPNCPTLAYRTTSMLEVRGSGRDPIRPGSPAYEIKERVPPIEDGGKRSIGIVLLA
jgi:hypothetical protein